MCVRQSAINMVVVVFNSFEVRCICVCVMSTTATLLLGVSASCVILFALTWIIYSECQKNPGQETFEESRKTKKSPLTVPLQNVAQPLTSADPPTYRTPPAYVEPPSFEESRKHLNL